MQTGSWCHGKRRLRDTGRGNSWQAITNGNNVTNTMLLPRDGNYLYPGSKWFRGIPPSADNGDGRIRIEEAVHSLR